MAGSSPRVSGAVCVSLCAREDGGRAKRLAALSCACRGRAEVKSGLVWICRRRGREKLANGPAVHQIGFDQPGEGERAFHDLVGIVNQPQQQEGDHRHRDLDANRRFAGSKEVVDLEGLFDPAEEQLDGPTPLQPPSSAAAGTTTRCRDAARPARSIST